jgi:hypothetical protein
MNWQKTGTRATAADPSAMLLVFSGFGRLHFTMKFESDLFPDSSKLDSDSPISMQFGVHWQKIRATLIRLKVLHSLSLVLLLLLMMVLLLLLLLLFWVLLLLFCLLFLSLLLLFWTQLPNLEMQPTFVRVGIVSADEGLDAWKRKF